jgi:sec-independent protein translocase protein TatA
VFDFSPIQIIIVLVIALLVFGPKRLPELGRTVGKGLREFKSSVSDFHMDDEPAPAPRTASAAAQGPAPGAPPAHLGPVDHDDEADEVLHGVVVSGAEPPATGSGERA